MPREVVLPALSAHARARAKARGIPLRIVEAVYANADRSPYVGGGCRSYMVSRRKLAALAETIPAADRERMEGVILVIDPFDSVVITVLHADRCNGQRYFRQRDGRRYRPRRHRS